MPVRVTRAKIFVRDENSKDSYFFKQAQPQSKARTFLVHTCSFFRSVFLFHFLLVSMPNMISSKLHSISEDGESGDCLQVQRGGLSSKSVMNGKRQPVNIETYSHSGNKAAFTWLILLFLFLGLTVQQASLSTVATRATTARSQRGSPACRRRDVAPAQCLGLRSAIARAA